MTITRYSLGRQAILWEGRGFYRWNPASQQWQRCTRAQADRLTAGNPHNLPGQYRYFDLGNTRPR